MERPKTTTSKILNYTDHHTKSTMRLLATPGQNGGTPGRKGTTSPGLFKPITRHDSLQALLGQSVELYLRHPATLRAKLEPCTCDPPPCRMYLWILHWLATTITTAMRGMGEKDAVLELRIETCWRCRPSMNERRVEGVIGPGQLGRPRLHVLFTDLT